MEHVNWPINVLTLVTKPVGKEVYKVSPVGEVDGTSEDPRLILQRTLDRAYVLKFDQKVPPLVLL